MNTIVWQPSRERTEQAELTRFRRAAAQAHGLDLDDYHTLHRWSVERPDAFWPFLWDWLGIIAGSRGDVVVARAEHMADTRWFPGARLSFAENLLRRRDDAPAIIARTAQGTRRELTFRALHDQVARVAASLADLGVTSGDRVAGILPNGPEAMIAMLAVNSLGAIWSSCAPELGPDGVIDRFGQIEPRVLFAEARRRDGVRRVREIAARLPTLEHTIVLGTDDGERDVLAWDRLLDRTAGELAFRRLPFDHPSFILYTSGTTGRPKCIVHGMGGMLLQLLKEHRLHYDLGRDGRFFYYTSTGWNMWYWVAIALAAEATIVLHDGSPFQPSSTALFDLADAERVTVFGISPPYLATLRASGLRPRDTHRLDTVRTILSTGSPLSPELYDWVYDAVSPSVCLSSISGGTEINACFATGNPAGPVHRGELQVLALGMAVDVFDEAGHPVRGAPGELVCTSPFPSQPVGFWGDPDGRRYFATYFERYPGVWHHGDFAELTASGGLVISGRSDATLKPGGHRIGTAEIYGQVEQLPEILDSIAIAQDWAGDVRIVLFVQLRPGIALDQALDRRIRSQIQRNTSPHHVPARIVAVADIPRTTTGKKAELAVRNMVHGQPVKNAGTLANPEALELYRGLEVLRS
jgi:acetoacetyl-CoA synthetase